MRHLTVVTRCLSLLAPCVLAQSVSVSAANPLDCSKESLTAAVAGAREKDPVISFTGVCVGPILITTDGLTLQGVGTAEIDGGGQNAVVVAGASRVSLGGIEVRNGLNGIVAVNGAHLSLTGVNVHDNALSGVLLQTGSSGVLSDVVIQHNGLHGLDLQSGSAATITDSLMSTANRVFGVNVNGSSITFATAIVTASQNALGVQIATNANAFINDRDTVLNAVNNLATGLTVVSGAQLVSFGGIINASGNPGAGVSVNSKAGIDLDAASQLNTFNNGDGLLIQHDSTITVFNTPQFSGAAGFSTINAHHNTRSGLRVATASTLTLVNQARVISTQNGTLGLLADNGAGITLVNSTLAGNTARDLQLSFGTRADLQTLTFGTATCDATVLVRGTSGIVCPQ